MNAEQLRFYVEEPSMEAFLEAWLPRVLPENCGYRIRVFQGKADLLKRLRRELATLSPPLQDRHRIVVLVDCDEGDCVKLKNRLETICASAGLVSRTSSGTRFWQISTRVVVKEMEAWYFGDWIAVMEAFPRVPRSIPQKAAFRSPDAIRGKAWKRFAEILTRHRYGLSELGKSDIAREIGSHIDHVRSRSPSFRRLAHAIEEACGQGR